MSKPQDRAWGNGCISGAYRLAGPDDGGIGPRQRPFRFATGWSSVGHQTVNCPFVRQTSIISNTGDRGYIVDRPIESS